MRPWTLLALGLALAAGTAHATDERTLKKLVAPAPAEIGTPLAGKPTQAVRLARVVVQLKPEPWAFIVVDVHGEGGVAYPPSERLVSWQEGQQVVKTSTLSTIFDEELRRSGASDNGNPDSVFSNPGSADLQLGVKITKMEGRFCKYCGWGTADRWTGAVVMEARWEVYSSLERKVIATIETAGGFNQGKPGLDGEPDRLINEAFRDNVRRLIASEDFRGAITTPVGKTIGSSALVGPTRLLPSKLRPPVGEASRSVAVVFSAEGSGSGFLISDDGYLLTNHHVVGASKYVKLKWHDGKESLGEVVRSDPRRDVALVKTVADGRPSLGLRSGPARQGEGVFAIGTPLDDQFQNTMSRGIVSATREVQGLSYIQSDVMVNHGSSGGPLLDEKGQVIGLTVSGRQENGSSVGLNFFIPIDDALKALALTVAG
ncbi:MAG TPA: trypsin-like peptidase domain-containing protein [Phenylobacterium sp.]|jgi:serine protease Do|uniref:S1C family serine protease n=1 Tax=Phenylobacterium sp. TaxID=1871053 RepID=UPI002CD17C7F|nr:trypsin-like peptidase domain-containing protein [Phenylobacterium sp.]HXA41233.1 trypsin-like peptidase domain-containing protein [Phenylobacterium sp.]